MKLLFQLLKLFPQFQRLLSAHFAAERAELQAQIEAYRGTLAATNAHLKIAADATDYQEKLAIRYAGEAQVLRGQIAERDAQIASLRNETTKKLQAVDALDSESVFNATLYSPKPPPSGSGS